MDQFPIAKGIYIIASNKKHIHGASGVVIFLEKLPAIWKNTFPPLENEEQRFLVGDFNPLEKY